MDLSPDEAKMLEFLSIPSAERLKMTPAERMERAGVPDALARLRALNRLESEGLVARGPRSEITAIGRAALAK